MDAKTHSPASIFGYQVRYVVPLFQRPYVWNEEDQWGPLWADVEAVTERLLDVGTPSGGPFGSMQIAPHFLGAIVLDQQRGPACYIGVRHVIDGQQRLTTLQLLLDAAQLVVERHGLEMDARALRVLVLNEPAVAQHPDEVFKVWPTNRDQNAFRQAMDNEVEANPGETASQVTKAHRFFVDQITEWADVTGDPVNVGIRLRALTQVLRDHLKVVVIDLEPGDNAQVIFETLNHRGAPLLAADLVKNLVFQVAGSEGVDIEALYHLRWEPFDSPYWRQEVAQGRLLRPRVDLFLNYWLTMRLRRDISTDRVFDEFRRHLGSLLEEDGGLEGLLNVLARDGKVYQDLDAWPKDSPEGIFYYRVIKTMDSAAFGPFLLWLLRWTSEVMSAEQRHRALAAVESWLVRRAICRMTSKAINRLVVDLLGSLHDAGPSVAGETTETFLASQTAESTLWPHDEELAHALRTAPLYKSLARARLRMVLEALEDDLRGPKTEEERCPSGTLTIEHIMPQGWREHWGRDITGNEVAALQRDRFVHTLGNLTLVNRNLNPALSNRPWTDDEAEARLALGKVGKHTELKHSVLRLNSEIVAGNELAWTERAAEARAEELICSAKRIWPRTNRPEASAPLGLSHVEPTRGDTSG